MRGWLYGSFLLVLMVKFYLFAIYNDLMFWTMGAAITFGSLLILSGWTLFLKSTARQVSLIVVNLLLSVLIFSDLIYFRYFSDFITLGVLEQSGQVGDLGGSVLELLSWLDLLFFIDIPIFVYILLRSRNQVVTLSSWRKRLTVSISAMVIGVLLITILLNRYIDIHTNKLFVSNWWNVSVYNITGLIGFHVFEANRFIHDQLNEDEQLVEQEVASVKTLFAQQIAKSQNDSPFYGVAKGKNVLVVQLESFQKFVIGKSIDGKQITPNINQFIKDEALYFDHFHHQVGQGRTSDAEFLINNSLYPLPSGAVYVLHSDNEFDSLPKILKQQGYQTASFHAYKKSFWNRQVMHKNVGFERFYSLDDFQVDEIVGWSMADHQFFDQTLDYIKQMKQPFYGFAIALSSHHPYTNVPEQYKQLQLGAYQDTTLGDYLTSAHYVDFAVGELIRKMKAEGLWDNTVLIMYGDHDSGISFDKSMTDFVGEQSDELNLQYIRHRVPLLMHIPGAGVDGQVWSHTTGMIDVTPTILHLLGIPNERYYHLGTNLFDRKNHLVIFRNGSATNGLLWYKASLDGQFQRGQCFETETRSLIDINQCRTIAQEADRQLKRSDQTIKYDLIRQLHQPQKMPSALR